MPEDQWVWQCDRAIPSDPAEARKVLDDVLQALKAHHWTPHDVFSVHLALHEALVNAIVHGNHQDRQKQVRVGCRLSADLLRIEIGDEGDGFVPDELPDPTDPDRLEAPTGRGVMLMRAFMSRVDYNDRGNAVVLEKRRGGMTPARLDHTGSTPAARPE